MNALYQNIKNRRLELGMTQSELAHKVGYADKGMISRIENGKVDLSQSQVYKFAEALTVDPYELMGWNNKYETEANSFVENTIFDIYSKLGYEEYKLLSIYNMLPYEAQKTLLKYADFIATDNGIKDAILTETEAETKNLHDMQYFDDDNISETDKQTIKNIAKKYKWQRTIKSVRNENQKNF